MEEEGGERTLERPNHRSLLPVATLCAASRSVFRFCTSSPKQMNTACAATPMPPSSRRPSLSPCTRHTAAAAALAGDGGWKGWRRVS